MRKSTLALLLGAGVMLLVLAGCQGSQTGSNDEQQGEEMTQGATEENAPAGDNADEAAPAEEQTAPDAKADEGATTVTTTTQEETAAATENGDAEEEADVPSGPAWKEEIPEGINKDDLKTEEAKLSYFYGTQIGTQLDMLGYNFNEDLLIRGIKDVLHDNEPLLTTAGMDQAYALVEKEQKKYVERRRKEREEAMAKKRAEAAAYMERNKKKEGFKTTDSGLQYKVLKEGDGKSPDEGDKVRVHYRGQLVDGTVFDSSYERGEPAEFVVTTGRGGVIPGWVEALQMMKEGGKWRLVVPPDLAYGERGKPPTGSGQIAIPSHAVLIFDVELLKDLGPAPKEETQGGGMTQQELLQRLIQQQMQQQGQGGAPQPQQ